ncbi:MAG: hypothetical protein AB1641_08490 [Thermodesulfobacteriota bacterium]
MGEAGQPVTAKRKWISRFAQIGLVFFISSIVVGKYTEGGSSAKYIAVAAFASLGVAGVLAIINALSRKSADQEKEAPG